MGVLFFQGANHMGYYAKNPYEQPEPPRCGTCDEFKVESQVGVYRFWVCSNPECEECAEKYKDDKRYYA